MKIFVMTVIFVMALTIAVVQLFRNRKHQELADEKALYSPYVFASVSLAVLPELFVGGGCGPGLITCLMPSVVCMSLLTSSLWELRRIVRWIYAFVAVNVLYAGYGLLCAVGTVPAPSAAVSFALVLMFMMLQTALFMAGMSNRMKSVKAVMKSGTVWANVCLGTDAAYLLIESLIVVSYLSICLMCGRTDGFHSVVFALLLCGMLAAYGCRIMTASVFLLWRKQEHKILESIKVTNVESVSDASRIDEVYREIYERVVAYFEREKPFLDCELTINDLVKVLYSNKLYISRAISQFTGRNFCQFVNYYRIRFSTECFKANHNLKIHEMASMSGFNSIVTFNMAFRLYMGENPSDWCRKERARFIKGEK